MRSAVVDPERKPSELDLEHACPFERTIGIVCRAFHAGPRIHRLLKPCDVQPAGSFFSPALAVGHGPKPSWPVRRFLAPGPNTASNSDKAGNPNLRPELATGFDLALEHYLKANGVMSLSVFRRNIRDLIRNVTSLETVPWAVSQRWVSRPQNIGNAITQGIEFDAKFRLDELTDSAVPLTVRSNLSVYGSSVSGVPGPYNRVDQQPRASANLGGDYRMRDWPLTVGGNFNWVPPYTVQQTDLQSQSFEIKRVVDAYALWTINRSTKLRLSLGNIVPRNYVTSSTVVAGGQTQTVVSNGPTYRVVGLRLEMKL